MNNATTQLFVDAKNQDFDGAFSPSQEKIPNALRVHAFIYRGYRVEHNGYAYEYAHQDYDGAPDSGDNRIGWHRSLTQALTEINILIEDGEL